jgi:cytochrome c peroxidase
VGWIAVLALVAGCSTAETPVPTPTPTPVPTLASVGEKLFHDPSLSASGQLACAGCHVAAQAHADAAGTFLPAGGAQLDQQGFRSSPSLRYLDRAPLFTVLGPGLAKGGLFWDGRADTRAAQAHGPLFNPAEMANADLPAFAARLRAVPYLPELLAVSGLDASASDKDLLDVTLAAIAAYQAGDPEFHPFSSKFDAVLDGRATLTDQEARGRRLFEDSNLGNCTACHPSALGPNGEKPVFTNFFYFALGVPRSAAQANADPAFFDLGLCGPRRTDLASRADLCSASRRCATWRGRRRTSTTRGSRRSARSSRSTPRATRNPSSGIRPSAAWCRSSTIFPRRTTATWRRSARSGGRREIRRR